MDHKAVIATSKGTVATKSPRYGDCNKFDVKQPTFVSSVYMSIVDDQMRRCLRTKVLELQISTSVTFGNRKNPWSIVNFIDFVSLLLVTFDNPKFNLSESNVSCPIPDDTSASPIAMQPFGRSIVIPMRVHFRARIRLATYLCLKEGSSTISIMAL